MSPALRDPQDPLDPQVRVLRVCLDLRDPLEPKDPPAVPSLESLDPQVVLASPVPLESKVQGETQALPVPRAHEEPPELMAALDLLVSLLLENLDLLG